MFITKLNKDFCCLCCLFPVASSVAFGGLVIAVPTILGVQNFISENSVQGMNIYVYFS